MPANMRKAGIKYKKGGCTIGMNRKLRRKQFGGGLLKLIGKTLKKFKKEKK